MSKVLFLLLRLNSNLNPPAEFVSLERNAIDGVKCAYFPQFLFNYCLIRLQVELKCVDIKYLSLVMWSLVKLGLLKGENV